jgi:hypothetical protein
MIAFVAGLLHNKCCHDGGRRGYEPRNVRGVETTRDRVLRFGDKGSCRANLKSLGQMRLPATTAFISFFRPELQALAQSQPGPSRT